jgi:site-specific recombinase XerD
MPTLAAAEGLTLEDFSFVRGVISGLSPIQSFKTFYGNRHFDAKGEPIIPHGLIVNKLAQDLESQILLAAQASLDQDVKSAALSFSQELPADVVSEPAKVLAHMDFTTWYDSIDPDMYRENELPAAYQEYLENEGATDAALEQVKVISRGQAIEHKIKALNFLQTQLAQSPKNDQAIEIWIARSITRRFKALGVSTMGELATFIGSEGRHWHRRIKGLGPGRASRIEGWLDDHAQSLGLIARHGPQWESAPELATALLPLQRVPEYQPLVALPGSSVSAPANLTLQRRFGFAPLELLAVPSELDGRTGMFRTTTPNHLGARNDYEAIMSWLGTFLAAGKVRTLEAYRREVERFYLWCLLEARTPLSSVALSHAQAYQAFLAHIPDHWISNKRVTREHDAWRPFRGQLHPKSQNYALGVVEQLFTALHKNAYVTGNPFASIRPNNAGAKLRAMDTTRTLHAGDLALVREYMDKLPGLASKDLRTAALARRTRLILHLAVTTGLRLSEIASTDLSTLRRAIVDGAESDDWMLTVTGKGSKPRDVPIQAVVLQAIYDHHADWKTLLPAMATVRAGAFEKAPPLIAVLQAPVRSSNQAITDMTVLANDNAALGSAGIARTLKTFFRQLAKTVDEPRQRARIQRFSTHWLRHTFAHEVLRANEGDEGLKLAQQLLGHASIATTAEYMKQDETAKVKAARKVNPLGLA